MTSNPEPGQWYRELGSEKRFIYIVESEHLDPPIKAKHCWGEPDLECFTGMTLFMDEVNLRRGYELIAEPIWPRIIGRK